jgi:Skp family chaperone for outer membrane proteins
MTAQGGQGTPLGTPRRRPWHGAFPVQACEHGAVIPAASHSSEKDAMKTLLAVILASALTMGALPAAAQTRDADATIKRLQTVLNVLNQELTATYEQIKALQAMLAANDRNSLNVQGRPKPLTTEDEVAEVKRKGEAREREIQDRIEAAFKRIQEIDAQKQPVLRRLREYLDSEQ